MQRTSVSRLSSRILQAMGWPFARVAELCCGIECRSIGISVIPGFLTANIGFRAGGSGRTRRFHSCFS